ncbi:MAG: hypothetical protein IKG46_01450 [Solobacterium sp.]|nr:hypothetical protein [Solobacterium sp.]
MTPLSGYTMIFTAILAVLIILAVIKSMWKLLKLAVVAGIIWYVLVFFGIL